MYKFTEMVCEKAQLATRTSQTTGSFATLMVILPSSFSGGVDRVRHNEITAEFDCSSRTLSDTTVLAYYTGVAHEISPVITGYRLVLLYDLIHTTSSLRPSITYESTFLESLRPFLLSWKHARKPCTPARVIVRLQAEYAKDDICIDALKGADARLVSLLNAAVDETGFQLGLGLIEHHLCGICEPCSDDEDSEELDFDFHECETRDAKITRLMKLDGSLIAKDLAVVPQLEAIPGDFMHEVEDEEFHEEYIESRCVCYPTLFVRSCFLTSVHRNTANMIVVRIQNLFDYD